jgi:hypothetical protein
MPKVPTLISMWQWIDTTVGTQPSIYAEDDSHRQQALR